MGCVREKYTKAYFLKHTEDGTPVPYGAEGIAEFSNGTIRLADAKILESVDFRGARVMEFGFGRGEAAKYIIEHGAAFYEGIDFSDAAVEIATGHLKQFGIPLPPLHHADALEFLRSYIPKYKSESIQPFTIISMLDFVEHVPRNELYEIFVLLKEIVASNVLFIVGTPAYPFDNEEDVEVDISKVALIDTADNIEETKGMHCNKYTLISLQQFMKDCGLSCVSQSHFFIIDTDSTNKTSKICSYRQRWDAAVKSGVPLQKDWRQDFIEYAYIVTDSPRWQQFKSGDLKGCRLFMTDTYYQLFEDGNYDIEMINDARGQELEGKTVFDVGGFMGITALLFAKRVGPTGRVCVFEPNPWNQDRMALNLSGNPEQASIISGYSCALSDTDGIAEMLFSNNVDNGNSSTSRLSSSHVMLSNNAVLKLGFHKCNIETLQLDTFVKRTGIIPDVIKVDIEGVEDIFLQGAKQMLKIHHPLLYIELHSPYCAIWCSRILEQLGYRIIILHEEEDGRLFIKAIANGDDDIKTDQDSLPTDKAIQLVVSSQNDLQQRIEQLGGTEQRNLSMSVDLQKAMNAATDLLKIIKTSADSHEQMLNASTITLQKIETKQQEFMEHIYKSISFKGMFVRACKLPFRLIRKNR